MKVTRFTNLKDKQLHIIIITLLLNCQLTIITKWYYNTHRVQVVIYLPKADEPFMTDSKVN